MDYQEFFSQCEVIPIKNEEHWHRLRKFGIGGSDVGIILNESKYKTPYQLYQEKIGAETPKFETNEAIEKGNRLEQPLVEVFKGLYPQYKVNDTKNISLKSLNYVFMNANLDGALIGPDGQKGILEIKTTTIHNTTMLEDWQRDSLPISYYLQCLHYMIVTGFSYCILFAMLDFPWKGDIGQQETRVVVINREDVLDDINYIIKEEQLFWKRVEDRNPPPFLSRTINI